MSVIRCLIYRCFSQRFDRYSRPRWNGL